MTRQDAAGSVPVTAIVPVRNEAPNLRRCLASLDSFERVIVVDSHSTDGTGELARACGADVRQFCYEGRYPKKRQWAIDCTDIRTNWIMLVDADEAVSPPLRAEIAKTVASPRFDAYLARKQFHFLGRRLRFGGFSHEAVVLFRRGAARFERLDVECPSLDMEVHERVVVDGSIGRLRHSLDHEDLKGLEKYIERHNAYSTWESRLRSRLLATGVYGPDAITARPFGNPQERRRFWKHFAVMVPCEPQLWFVYHYFLRLGLLEGRRGLIACQLRAAYIRQVRAKMFEARIRAGDTGSR